MVTQITQGIRVSVSVDFNGIIYNDSSPEHLFTYHITIENNSKDTVQLLERSWIILDALNDPYTVVGEGVVGKKPILESGAAFIYHSHVKITSPYGCMKGAYTMINFSNSSKFQVTIPAFILGSRYSQN